MNCWIAVVCLLLLRASLSTRSDSTVFVLPIIRPRGQMTVMDSSNDEDDEDEDDIVATMVNMQVKMKLKKQIVMGSVMTSMKMLCA